MDVAVGSIVGIGLILASLFEGLVKGRYDRGAFYMSWTVLIVLLMSRGV